MKCNRLTDDARAPVPGLFKTQSYYGHGLGNLTMCIIKHEKQIDGNFSFFLYFIVVIMIHSNKCTHRFLATWQLSSRC